MVIGIMNGVIFPLPCRLGLFQKAFTQAAPDELLEGSLGKWRV